MQEDEQQIEENQSLITEDSEEQQIGGYQSFTDKYSRFTVSIGNEVYKVLDKRAKAEKRNKSFFVEEALKEYFSHPPGAVQEPAVSSQAEASSSAVQDSLNQILERLNQQQVQIESFSDSLNQVSERTESFQNQIDAVKNQAAELSQAKSKPPVDKSPKKTPTEIEALINQIQSIDDIQPDRGYLSTEASAILLHLLKNPDADACHTAAALTKRAERGFKGWNLKPEDIGYKDDNGKWHIRGSYLQHHLKQEPAQENIVQNSL